MIRPLATSAIALDAPSRNHAYPQRAPESPPHPESSRTTPPSLARCAYWIVAAIVSSGLLALVPLYLHAQMTAARLESVERYADTLCKRVNAVGARVQVLESSNSIGSSPATVSRVGSSDPSALIRRSPSVESAESTR